MQSYSVEVKHTVRKLRQAGHTYSEIQIIIGYKIPKSTLSYMCRDILLTNEQRARIESIMRQQLAEKRKKALIANRRIFDNKLLGYKKANSGLAEFIQDRQAKLIALSMLYLGEGTKWKSNRSLSLGSSDPQILNLYIDLLRECYEIPASALKCRVQHRADQNSNELVDFWSKSTGVPLKNFYPSYVDKRTVGKPTKKTDYKGVCVISGGGTAIQLELAQIADIISGSLRGYSSVD